ncbi:MAG: transposase [Candidatus Muiribacteriota bacterium]
MARQLRIEFEGAHYHVFARGERKDTIFLEKQDYEIFIEKLKEMLNKFNIECCAFALMPNHYHLYLITNEANLTQAMHYLNSSYTNWYKAKHQIVGHVFQGRYKALLVDKGNYFFRVIDYIHLNPVVAGIVEKPWEYHWSSCENYVGISNRYNFINKFNYLSTYSNELKTAELKYKEQILNSKNKKLPHRDLFKGIAIGKEDFKKKVDNFIKTKKIDFYVPTTKMNKTRNVDFFVELISDYFKVESKIIFNNKRNNKFKKIFIYLTKKYSRLTNKEIASLYGMTPSAVSEFYRKFLKNIESEKILNEIKNIESEKCRPDPFS